MSATWWDPFPPRDNDDGDGDGDDLDTRIRRNVQRWLENNSSEDAVEQLLRDNFEQRDQLRDLRRELEEAREQIPSEDAVVLEGEEAEAWQPVLERGDPEEVATALKERDELADELTGLRRERRLEAAAAAHGLNAGPLRRLAEQDGLEVELEEEENEEGETVQRAVVTNGDEDAEPVALEEYAEENWSEFLPALKADESGAGGSEDEGSSGGGKSRRYPATPGTTSPSDTEVSVEDVAEDKREAGDYRI